MARSHGRLLARIWSDDDFRTLPADAQRLYMLLISQPNLTHAGTMSITVRRWARMSTETSIDDVMAALRVLSDERYVLVDWDTEELLIRTLVRNDGVFKQPRVFQVAASEMLAVSSVKLRYVMRCEMSRLPLDEVTDKARPDVEKELARLLADLPDTPPDTPAPTPAEGSDKESGRGIDKAPRVTRGRARGGSPSPSPSPSPAPTPSPTVSDGADEPPPKLRAVEDSDDPDAGPVVAAYIDGATKSGRGRPSDRLIGKVGRDAKRLIRAGTNPERLRSAAQSMGSSGWDDLDRELQDPRRPRPSASGYDLAAGDEEWMR